MKTYRILIEDLKILFENRIDYLKKNNPEIDSSHDSNGIYRDSGDIIDHFSGSDPTKKKIYTGWILDQYKKKHIRQEDVDRVRTTLSNFDRYKVKLGEKDIGKYKNLGEVDDAIRPHLGSMVTNREKEGEIMDSGRELLHDGGGIKVYHLKTKEASQKIYGGGSIMGNTDWCTAVRSNGNAFDRYNKLGKIYTIHTDDGKKYQFHFEDDQFMDERDIEVDLKGLVKKYPELKKVNEFQGKHWDVTDDKDKHWNQLEKHINPNDIDINGVNDIVKSKIQKLKNDFNTSKSSDNPDILHNLKNHPNIHVRKNISTNPNTSPQTLDYMKNHENRAIRSSVAKNPNTSSNTLDHMKDDKNENVRYNVARNPNTSSDTLHHMKDDNNYFVRYNVASNPNTKR